MKWLILALCAEVSVLICLIFAFDGAMQQALYIAQWTRAGVPGVKYAQEGTGHGFKTVRYLEPKLASMPTTCVMKRP